MIEGRKLTKAYHTPGGMNRILDEADIRLEKGGFVALVGRSGTGKTTVLNLLGGLDEPTSGELIFEGRHIESMSDTECSAFRNQAVGFIFQTFFLRPMRTALENVMVPMHFNSMPLRAARERAHEALEEVGLGAFANTRTSRLSGGQRQRVAIARAIVNHPRLLLADEPTGNLDTTTSLEIFELLRAYNRSHATAIVVVTHDPLVEVFGIPMLTISSGKLISHTGRV
jgi:ABC-type lipoprotein export system ATPase subunit